MKDFNIAKYLKENNLGSHGILGKYVDLHGLKEEEDYGNNKPVDEVPYTGADAKLDGFGDEFDQVQPVSEAEGSFGVSFLYADYPSISDAAQRLAIIHFKKLVKSLGGDAVVTNDDFDTVDFDVTGISSFEELQNAYNDVVENEDDNYTTLPSWDIEPKEGGVEEEVAVSSSGVEMEELEKPEKIYQDEEDSADQGDMERMYEVFEYQLQRLVLDIIDDGYGPEDAAQFLRDYANHIDKGGIK